MLTEGQANLPLRMAAKHALYSVFFYCFNYKHNIALSRNSDSYIAFGRQCTFIYEAIFFSHKLNYAKNKVFCGIYIA